MKHHPKSELYFGRGVRYDVDVTTTTVVEEDDPSREEIYDYLSGGGGYGGNDRDRVLHEGRDYDRETGLPDSKKFCKPDDPNQREECGTNYRDNDIDLKSFGYGSNYYGDDDDDDDEYEGGYYG